MLGHILFKISKLWGKHCVPSDIDHGNVPLKLRSFLNIGDAISTATICRAVTKMCFALQHFSPVP